MEILTLVSEMVKAQASQADMTPDDMAEGVKKVYRALKWVQAQEEKADQSAEEPKMSGPSSIQRNKVVCLECGKEFKQLSAKHLALHGTDRREYKKKHGIPLRQALSSKSLSAQRRKVAKEKELGKKQAKAKTKGKGKKRQRTASAAGQRVSE
jgi:predicted transcriptional regulator